MLDVPPLQLKPDTRFGVESVECAKSSCGVARDLLHQHRITSKGQELQTDIPQRHQRDVGSSFVAHSHNHRGQRQARGQEQAQIAEGWDRQIFAWETGPLPHEIKHRWFFHCCPYICYGQCDPNINPVGNEVQSRAHLGRTKLRFLGGLDRLLVRLHMKKPLAAPTTASLLSSLPPGQPPLVVCKKNLVVRSAGRLAIVNVSKLNLNSPAAFKETITRCGRPTTRPNVAGNKANELVPSSHQSSFSAASPLPSQLESLLADMLQKVKVAIGKVLPVSKKRSALEEAQWEDASEEGMLKREMLMQSMETLRVCRPRLVLHGQMGMGQGYIGAAALHYLEDYHLQNLDLGMLMGDSTRLD
ncbi:hypothetical protein BU15DRAFT_76796 [Melanogaster broomeanus]|nr:hypothetical protein BU15DRAFT_76796 [Melanogaster broomeanus]